MGLIIKKESQAEKQRNLNYKARYVELVKPMAGATALAIYYMLEGDNPDIKIKLSSNIAAFICWILGEQIIHRVCVYFNLYTKPNSKNPLYRNLKTLSSLGLALGTILASLMTSLSNKKLSISIYSMLMGSVIGLFAFIIQQFNGTQDEANIDAQVGTEGWSKYTKTALVLGASIGQLLGGIISSIQGCDTTICLRNITLYGAIASVVSFFSVLIFVPLINYLTRNKNNKMRGILVTDDRDIFNNNYVRSGLTIGVAIGTILGGFLGPAIISGLSIEAAIAIGASLFSIICGIGLGFYGQKLTVYFDKFWGVSLDTENSWSYAARSTAYFFSYSGIALAYAFCPAATLMSSAIVGSAIASLLGWFAGLFIIWLARKIEPDEAKTKAAILPWTQRLSVGSTRGAIIGAFAGLAIGFLAGGPFGLIGWSVFLSAVGGIIGGIKDIISDPVFYKFINKATSSLFSVTRQSKPALNRYSLFSCEETGNFQYSCRVKQNRFALLDT